MGNSSYLSCMRLNILEASRVNSEIRRRFARKCPAGGSQKVLKDSSRHVGRIEVLLGSVGSTDGFNKQRKRATPGVGIWNEKRVLLDSDRDQWT